MRTAQIVNNTAGAGLLGHTPQEWYFFALA